MDKLSTSQHTPSSSPEVFGGKWITQFNEPTGDALIVHHGNAWRLLSWIAKKANWKDGFPDNRLKEGQCFVRGCAVVGMTDQEYKTAKHVLGPERFNLVALEKHNKGTLFTLTSTTVFAVNSKVFFRGAKVETRPTNEPEGTTQPPRKEPAAFTKKSVSTSTPPQPSPISTGGICVAALANNEQETLPNSEKNHRPATTKPENCSEQTASGDNQKPAPEARKQRAASRSGVTAPDLEIRDLEKDPSSKLEVFKRNGSISRGGGFPPIAEEDLQHVPSFVGPGNGNRHFQAWCRALEAKYGRRLGAGDDATWAESYGGLWWVFWNQDAGLFKRVWNEALLMAREKRIIDSIGGAARDLWDNKRLGS